MPVTMRPLVRSDWRALKELRLLALSTEPGVFFSSHEREVGAADDVWQSLAAGGDGLQVFGAYDGAELVGITGVFTHRDDPTGATAALGMTYLLPQYRGQGLSARFYETRLRWIREQPRFTRVAVSHRRSNEASRRAIQRAEFVPIGQTSRTWPDGGVEDEVMYELPLTQIGEIAVVELCDADFAEMLRGAAHVRPGLAVPPGGVDDPVVVSHVRRIVARLHEGGYEGGHWMIVAGGEAVGMCGIKYPPSADGEVEIGYGIAASRHRRGHMTRGLALVLEAMRRDPAIRTVLAETAVGNIASQRVLASNGFERIGTRVDPADGELVRWRKRL
jgi:RimJ/RimL family protein N-acetyltransferase